MGDPKYPRRAWRKPKRPLNYDLKMEELKTLGTFGLRTKRELWKAHTELSRVRHQARSLLALRQEIREEKEPILMKSLERIGLVRSGSTLDDVLNLNVDDLLARRLQTIVTNKLGFKTPYQARQAVIHGHIMIGERRVDIPSYTVTVDEEPKIHFTPESKIPQMLETEASAKEAEAQADTLEATQAGTPETTAPAGTPETTAPAGTPETTAPAGTPETTAPAEQAETPAGTPEATAPAEQAETPAGTPETTAPAEQAETPAGTPETTQADPNAQSP